MGSENQFDPYAYTLAGGPSNSYYFTTIDQLTYEIKFVPSSEFFEDYEELDVDVFEMVISVIDNPSGGRMRADPLVAPTIFRIFEDFFLAQRHVIVFICDSSDGRERARFRKFDRWFYSSPVRSTEVAKIDRVIPDGDVMILLSMMLSRRHPQLLRLVDMFAKLGDETK